MYQWRMMTEEQRAAVLQLRKQERRPWHSPPHYQCEDTTYYMLTAACFEHKQHIGYSAERILAFEDELVATLRSGSTAVFAWNVLPNHYHAIVDTPSVTSLMRELGQLHGRNSFVWNGEESKHARQVWCNMAETAMNSEGHFHASLNYVLQNATEEKGTGVFPVHCSMCSAPGFVSVFNLRRRQMPGVTRFLLFDAVLDVWLACHGNLAAKDSPCTNPEHC